jgi:hypothetical protein
MKKEFVEKYEELYKSMGVEYTTINYEDVSLIEPRWVTEERNSRHSCCNCNECRKQHTVE